MPAPVQTLGQDTLKTRSRLKVGAKTYTYYSVPKAAKALGLDFDRLPYSLKVILENLLRFEDGGRTVYLEVVIVLMKY